MTLRKQLLIVTVLLFILVFSGTFFISVKNTHSYLSAELASQAQNTASALGISISQYGTQDRAVIESLVDAVFETGYYQAIRVVSPTNEVLGSRIQTVTKDSVPEWFKKIEPIEVTPGTASISSGWKQGGTVFVYSNTSIGYEQLWNNTVATFYWFLGCAIITFILGMIALRYLLKPLAAVVYQAEAICNRDFSIQNPLPRIKEFATVVAAMNKVSAKVQQMFAEQTELTEKLRDQAYKDPLTDLPNRRYFTLQLEHLTNAPEEFFSGAFYLIELTNFDLYKKSQGYEAAELYLNRIASLLKALPTVDNQYLPCRLGDTTFGLLAPNLTTETTEQLATSINMDLIALHARINAQEVNSNMGVAFYRKGLTTSQLLSQADMALRAAQSKGNNSWYLYDEKELPSQYIQSAHNWHELLEKAIEDLRIVLYFQPIVTLKNSHKDCLHHEVLLRILDQNNHLLNAGIFIPMAENLNMMADIDKAVIKKLMLKVNAEPAADSRFAVNISPSSLKEPRFLEWLGGVLTESPHFAKRLILELPEYTAVQELSILQKSIDQFSKLDVEFSLDHFGRGFTSLKYLSSLKVSYLKIDGSYVHNVHRDANNQFFIHIVTEIAHNLDIKIIAENVENAEELTTLRTLNVDGVQGYFVGKPDEKVM